jgi:hypothetical protein
MIVRFILRRAFRHNGLKYASSIRGRRGYNGSLVEDAIDLAPKFDEQAWEEGVQETLSWAVDQAGNPGQTTLLEDFFTPKALDYCEITQEDFDPEEFVSIIKDDLGDDYYFAINEIIDETAQMLDELREECHTSFIENLAYRMMFGSAAAGRYATKYAFGAGRYLPTPGGVYANMDTAIRAYEIAAARNGYKSTSTPEGRSYNREKNRQWLIQRFGSGKTQPVTSRSGMENMPGYAAYQKAAARNGKIIRP